MNKEEYDKYKKVVAELDGYDICDEFNLGTYELKDKKKLLEIILMYYFKNQDELEEKDKEIERLNNIIEGQRIEIKKSWKEINKYKNIINELEKLLENPYNVDCINQNNDFLRRIKELKEDKNE